MSNALNTSELSKIIYANAEEWHVAASGMKVEDEALHIFWRSLSQYYKAHGKINPKDLGNACNLGARIFVSFRKKRMPGLELLESYLFEETLEGAKR